MIETYPIDENKIWTGEIKEITKKDSFKNLIFDKPPELSGTEVAIRMGKNWVVLPEYPEKIIPGPSIPTVVTMKQARLALLQMGMLDQIETTIEAIEDPQIKAAVKIEWEYAQEVDRNHQWVQSLSDEMGLTDEQLDQLFSLASTL